MYVNYGLGRAYGLESCAKEIIKIWSLAHPLPVQVSQRTGNEIAQLL